jgi:subfamily B ATP-binding cassette protein MsbA
MGLRMAGAKMGRSVIHLVATLFRWQKTLLLRFVITSVGRAVTTMAVVFFIREFLAGAVDEPTGFTKVIADTFGASAVLWVAAAMLLATYLAGAILYYDNQIVVQRIIKVIELGVMQRLIRHLLALSVPYSDRQQYGDVIQTLRNDVTQLRMVVHASAQIALEALVVAGLMIMAAWISPYLSSWVLLVLPIVSLPIFLISKQLRVRSFAVRRTNYLLFDMILEILKGMRVIKTFRGEEMQVRMSIDKGASYFDEVIQMIRLQALGRVGMESLAGLSVVVVVLVGGFQVIEGSLSWPSLLAFVMAVRIMHTPLHLIHKQYVEIQTWHASVQRIADFLAIEPQIRERPAAKPLASAPATISCEDVSFAYDQTSVLQGITFKVSAGETIGIVGPSGAGKSTLLNLLVRLYDPTAGRICFDGQDLRWLRLGDIYEKVAIVAQEPFLFSTSVRENIRCGRPTASDDDVQAAAKAACIHDEILALPEGYETLIGIGGRELSRGQAQRINVARAFLKSAPILLLDEATSSLDSVAEANVQRAIDRLMEARTSFVVAHRLSTLRNAHRLLVLEQGRLVGFGPHEQLLRECELYRSLWEAQQLMRVE